MAMFSPAPRLVAVLGPTNTGKTHLAIERMLGHKSGMIGFPLRLLARENYDRIVKLRGARAVALITGEEKILPPNPSYFVCTVESMPLDRAVDFLAVDEIQLCADPERGHVFTARLLHARGVSRNDVSGRRHDQAADAASRPRIRAYQPAALFDPDLYRTQEGDPAAAPQCRRRLCRRRRVFARRADPASARRHRCRARGAVATGAQCPGRDVPGR